MPSIENVCAQDLVKEAFAELRARPELDQEFERLKVIEARWGY